MFTAIIIEDERNSREFLEKLLKKSFSDKILIIGVADSVAKGVQLIKQYQSKLDIVYLDIHLPEENGFELFKYFNEITFEVIFTTAYKDYSIDAIRYSAFDYLLKPINFIDLNSSIKRLENKQIESSKKLRLDTLFENLTCDSVAYNKVAFPTLDGFVLEKISNILYCVAQSNYTLVKTVNGKEILLSKTLKHIEEMLPSPIFCRTHKSYLVNLNYVVSYARADNSALLSNKEEIPVSVRKNEHFLNAIQNK